MVVIVAVIVFQNTDSAHVVKQLLKFFFTEFGVLCKKVFKRVVMTHFHFQRDVRHFVGNHAGKSPVFGIVYRDAQNLMVDAVGDLSCEFENFFSRIGIAHKLRCVSFTHLCHCCFLL